MKTCFLYQLIFPSGVPYTGISIHPQRRLREHFQEARKGSELPVHRAIRKYGELDVKQMILAEGSREQMQALEVKTIALCKGYNASIGGEQAPMLGMKHGPETKERMRLAHKGVKQTAEWIERRASTQRGVTRSQESRKRMSEGQKRRSRSAEEISRMGDLARNRNSTPEWRENLRIAALARWKREREARCS